MPISNQIIVVNDEPFSLASTSRILEREGWQVTACNSAEEALTRMGEQDPPDIIITDLHMPGMDGWRFCRLLRSPEYAAFNQTPILVLSATFVDADPRHLLAELGADAFLSAPCTPSDLLKQVQDLVNLRAYRGETRVLIAANDPEQAEAFAGAFAQRGYICDVALAREAELAEQHTPDIVVLSSDLPDVTHERFLERVRRLNPAAVVILITAEENRDKAVDLMHRGVDSFVCRPPEVEYLINLCEQARHERSLGHIHELLRQRTLSLLQSEERYKSLVENVPTGIIETAPDGQILFCNPRTLDILGYESGDFHYLRAQDLFVDLADWQDLEKNLLSSGFCSYQYRLRHKDGHSIWTRGCSRTTLDKSGSMVYLGIVEDITAGRQLEDELKSFQTELSSLHAHLLSVRNAARIQILREVESELGPVLKGVREDLSQLDRLLAEDQQPAREKIRSMERFIDMGNTQLHQLVREWRPPSVDEGLVAALRWQVERFQQRTGVRTEFNTELEEIEVDPELCIEIFYMVQELLDNVARHAQARETTVVLRQEREQLVVEVGDNGRGINPTQIDSGDSLGLISIRERTRILGGRFDIQGYRGLGTRARISLAHISAYRNTARSASLAGPSLRVLIVSSYGLVRAGLCQILTASSLRFAIGQAEQEQEVMHQAREQEWDVIILDFSTERASRLEILKQLQLENLQLPVLLLGTSAEISYLGRGLKAGAAGCLTWEESPEVLIKAIQQIIRGEKYVDPRLSGQFLDEQKTGRERPLHETLSDREYQVLCEVARGKKMAQVAEALTLSVNTIRTYRARILEKMEMETDAELIRYALQQNLID